MINAGIDLGDLYSSIAHVNAEDIPTIFSDSQGTNLFRTPSLVHLGPDGCFVGEPVNRLLAGEPDLSIVSHAKLALGSRAPIHRDSQQHDWSPAAINALLLTKLRHDATSCACEELGTTVIAVPAQFGDAQRRAVRRAADLAGITSVSLVDEPIAAAAYLLKQHEQEQTVLVYDLGGSSFNATLLRSSDAEISTLATEHSDRLGGRWIDELIVELMTAEWCRVYGAEQEPTPADLVELRRLAAGIKLKLCQSNLTQVHHQGLVGSRSFEFLLTKQHFEKLIQRHLAQSLDITEKCMQTAGVDWPVIDQILLVGGSTLIPQVPRMLAERSGKPSSEIVARQPQHSIAFGAALLASDATKEQHQRIPALRQAIATYDLGVRIRHPRTGQLAICKLIKRNSTLPSQATKVFKTSRDDQTRLVIEVVQSLGNATEASSLGFFAFGPIERPHANYPIEVLMQYDQEGLVNVTARASDTGLEMAHGVTHDEQFATQTNFDAERDLVASAVADFI